MYTGIFETNCGCREIRPNRLGRAESVVGGFELRRLEAAAAVAGGDDGVDGTKKFSLSTLPLSWTLGAGLSGSAGPFRDTASIDTAP